MILEIRSMMKSIRHFTYPSKICKNQSVPLNATKDEYIVSTKKAIKYSSSNEEHDLE